MSNINDHDLIESYRKLITYARSEWLRVPTSTGRPKRGPRAYVITLCGECTQGYGTTSTAEPKGRRWACNTCFGFAEPIWADGPIETREEAQEQWAEWAAKQSRKKTSDYVKTRRRLGRDV